jgi:O-antigen/teichoic acid export membrane protein
VTVIKRNAVANLAGRIWSNILALAFVPVYLHFLGIEAYGLVGFAATMQGVLLLLDVGIGASLLRELARLSAIPDSAREQRDTVRTLETIYWCIALAGGALVFLLAPLIATHWVRPQHLATAVVITSIRIIGLIMAMQFPFGFYESGLMGLQRQVFVNMILATSGTVRALSAVLVLWLVSPTIQAFLLSQAITTALATVVIRFFLWRAIPSTTEAAAFRPELFSLLWKFAAGTAGIALANALFYQVDKVLLSRWLTLSAFGYYMLAQSVAGVLWSLVRPISAAVFPRFSQLAVVEDEQELRTLYHGASQSMSSLLAPVGVVLMFFSYDVIAIWTHNVTIASNAAPIAALAAIGIVAVGLADVPHFLRLAYGWVGLSLKTNLVLLIALLPVLALATFRYGAIGAVSAWAAVNIAYLAITVPITHTRVLRGAFASWALKDTVIPVAAAVAIAALARMVIPREGPLLMHFAQICAAGLVVLLATAITAPAVRRFLFARFA